jgi:membrane-associated protein
MKYASFLPLSALVALGLINLLVHYDVIPPGLAILESLRGALDQGFYVVIFLIILLESIVYLGFYFPGQFFAVLLVVGAKPTPLDVLYLTIAMVLAATIGSAINYYLGKTTKRKDENASETKLKHLLLAMIHINSLAFFMFSQGANNKTFKVVLLAGLLNLPYYLLLIAGTAVLSEEVMAMAENTVLLFSLIGIWLVAAMVYDFRKHKKEANESAA